MTLLGYGLFVGVKLLGYCAFAWIVQRWLGAPRWATFVVGLARTLVGMAAGWAVVMAIAAAGMESFPLFLALLVPVRIVEWQLVLRLAFRAAPRKRVRVATAVGVLWSYALDAVALFAAAAVPGGLWVC